MGFICEHINIMLVCMCMLYTHTHTSFMYIYIYIYISKYASAHIFTLKSRRKMRRKKRNGKSKKENKRKTLCANENLFVTEIYVFAPYRIFKYYFLDTFFCFFFFSFSLRFLLLYGTDLLAGCVVFAFRESM